MCNTVHSCILFNRKYRYISFSQLANWLLGYLGLNHRKVLPACAVTKIRGTFPSAQYTGFHHAQAWVIKEPFSLFRLCGIIFNIMDLQVKYENADFFLLLTSRHATCCWNYVQVITVAYVLKRSIKATKISSPSFGCITRSKPRGIAERSFLWHRCAESRFTHSYFNLHCHDHSSVYVLFTSEKNSALLSWLWAAGVHNMAKRREPGNKIFTNTLVLYNTRAFASTWYLLILETV